jgi:hypothetical protein
MTPISGITRINTPIKTIGCFTYTIQPTGALTHTPEITLSSGGGKIDWGDNTAQENITSGVAMSHNYTAGTYTIKIFADLDTITKLYIATSEEYIIYVENIGSLTNLTEFRCHSQSGWSQNISGWTLPSKLQLFHVHYTSVSGDISGWAFPNSLQRFYIFNTSVSGNISGWTLPSGLLYFYINSTSVSGVPTISSASNIIKIDYDDCGLLQADVDGMLQALYNSRSIFTYATPALDIAGTNAAPSGIYQDADPPTTGREYEYELENDPELEGFNKWTIATN